jgi:hypothetical protein
LSVDPVADSSSVSTLIEENVRVLATPFLVTFSVLSKNNPKAHACPPIAVRAGHAKSQHSLAKLVTRSMPFRAGSDFDTTRTNTKGLSKQLAAQSHQQN